MAISLLDEAFTVFMLINNDELVSKWGKFSSSEKSKYGCERKGYACFLNKEFDRFQNGETKYK